jgi:hypothetical protein
LTQFLVLVFFEKNNVARRFEMSDQPAQRLKRKTRR